MKFNTSKYPKNDFKIMFTRLKIIVFIITFTFIQYGCTNDSTADLIDSGINNDITYTNTVKSIINNNCLSCHSQPPQNGAPMPLTTYEDVKNAVLNRGLLDRISRGQGASGMMPLGGIRLPQATIDKITLWAENNFQE